MLYKIIPISVVAILLLSCSKTKQENLPAHQPANIQKLMDETENKPVIIVKTLTADGNPLPLSDIWLTRGVNVMHNISDQSGRCSFFPGSGFQGQYVLNIFRNSILVADSILNVQDSVTAVTYFF